MSLVRESPQSLQQRFLAGDLSCADITAAHLKHIAALDPSLNSFRLVQNDSALAQAAAIDDKRRRGQPLGSLAGLSVAVKDNICQLGTPTTAASKSLASFRPPYNAHVVSRLLAQDAVIIGRTNLDEFAMGSSGENSAFGPTHNPWSLDHSPGGSSSGSAAAVAARFAPLALGSDTGGSIRQPASFCSCVGLKPTYGRVSRYGLIAFASSLDQIGPFATNVHAAALLLNAIAGHDPRDSTSASLPTPDFTAALDQPLTGLRVGLAREHFASGLDPEVHAAIRAACDVYKSQGAKIVDMSLPHSQFSVAAYYLIACSEASSNLARYDGIHYGHRATEFDSLEDLYARSRGESFGPEVKRRIMLGTYALSAGYYDAYYLQALKVRRLIARDFESAFASVDLILSPVSPILPFKIGELLDDPLAMYLADIYTISANLAGLPAISLPAGFSNSGLPIGLQLLAPPFEESRLLRAARMFESSTNWHTSLPPTLASLS